MATLYGAAPVRPACAQLADLICSDPDLLHAEFDAIISAAWGSDVPPGRPQRPAAPRPPSPGPARIPRRPHPQPCRAQGCRRLQRRARQRAPPGRPTLDTDHTAQKGVIATAHDT
ncbi:hypothetical protein ACG83_37945 [Frankia sp. R43]|uniref:hypothetical protein n=1 Tax=Frankia sp. R43 TaxID=269536 RepID=UPI0006CA1285|nr:hypothetical protein [Frankia sp. R43]KPM50810.1 hypothetical protein ACG83_37945 [Frankia sp. R43]